MVQFGFSQADITPERGRPLSGYGFNLDRVGTAVADPLWARTIGMVGQNGVRAVIGSLDWLSLGPETTAQVQAAVNNHFGDERTVLALHATHTHSGPATRELPGVGGYDEAYLSTAVPKVAATVIEALETAKEGKSGAARAEIDGINYNRAGMPTEVDRRVTAVKIATAATSVLVANFAGHPTVLRNHSTLISSDYPGAVRALLEEQTGANAVFWTGCCGDQSMQIARDNNYNTTTEHVNTAGQAIGQQVLRLLPEITLGTGELRASTGLVELPVDPTFEFNLEREVEHYRQNNAQTPDQSVEVFAKWLQSREQDIRTAGESIQVPVTLIAIGKWAFVGYGAEVYSQTGRDIEAAFPKLTIVHAQNVNASEGYLARAPDYDKQNYGAWLSAFVFGRPPLARHSEAVFQAGVKQQIAATLS